MAEFDPERARITVPFFELHNTSFKRGFVTKIEIGEYYYAPENTALKIQGDDGHEYNFTGPKAYNAVKYCPHPVVKDQYVSFLAKNDTKEVVAIGTHVSRISRDIVQR